MTTVLLWDIDGTLLTTARAGIIALQDAVHEVFGTEPDLSGLRTDGLTDFAIGHLVAAEAVRRPVSDADVAELLGTYGRRLPGVLGLRDGRVLPGVEAILADLAGRPEVVSLLLTGNTEAGAHAKLAHFGLDRWLSAGAFSTSARDRADIARAAVAIADRWHGADVSRDRVHVIGDTPRDVACGRAIGARTIAVATGRFTVDELRAAGAWAVLPELPAPGAFRRLVGIPAPDPLTTTTSP
jgi:phosphoglycolate phosphatase